MRMGIGLGVGINRSNYAQGIFNAYSARVVADGGVVESGTCVDAVSGILLNASLLLIPSGYKSGKAYAEIPTNGNGDLTWTRTSTAIRTNSSSLLESMATGVPRLSYMYGSCPALLLEPQRTNLYLYSNDFSNAFWLKNNVSITSNSSTSPDGNINATTLIGNGVSIPKNIVQNISVTLGVTYTITFFARKNTNSFVQIATSSATFASTSFANFDLNNGVVGTVGSTSTATIQSMGNGWYRCSMTATATATASGGAGIYLISASNSVRAEVNTLSTDIYIYGFQFEQGSYATTYIPTTSATATRVADSASKTGISSLIGQTSGSVFVEFISPFLESYTQRILTLSDGTNTNVIGFQLSSANQLIFYVESGGVNQVAITKTSPSITLGSNVKIAAAYANNDFVFYVNGTQIGTDTSGSVPATSQLRFSEGNGTAFYYGQIKQVALFDARLTNSQLATLTT